MTEQRALILLPCCRDKQPTGRPTPYDQALPGLEVPRSLVREHLTSALAVDRANRAGLLRDDAPVYAAHDLYRGNLYRSLGPVWARADADVLIVSAAYGLVLPGEGLRTYELQMSDTLATGEPLYKFWQRVGLAHILQDYIRERGITHVWSLLPDSMGAVKTPYHRVFNRYWHVAAGLGQRCYHVKVRKIDGASAGTGTGAKRGRWLAEVLHDLPGMLTGAAPLQPLFLEIPGYSFVYERCGGIL